jgi:hypothetical protein
MADAQFKATLNGIVGELNANKELLTEVRADSKAVFEILNTLYQRVEDMSKKFDEVLNAGIKKPRTDESGGPAKKAEPAVAKKPRASAKKATASDKEAGGAESAVSSTVSATETPAKKKPVTKAKASEAASETKSDGGKVVNNIMTYFKTKYLEDSTTFNDILDAKQAEEAFAKNAADIDSKKAGPAREKAKAMALYKSTTKEQKKKIRDRIINEQEAASVNNDEDVEEAPDSD